MAPWEPHREFPVIGSSKRGAIHGGHNFAVRFAGRGSRSTQRDRLGSAASKEEVEYWNKMMSAMSPQTKIGIGKVSEALNMEGVLPRISAPTLVITTDRSVLQSVETVLEYQKKIPNSRLLVLPSDAYHVAVAKADECVTNVLSFIKETRQRA